MCEEVYGALPSSFTDSTAVVRRPPPSCIKTTIYEYVDRETGRPFGWAAVYLQSRDPISTTPPMSAVFTVLQQDRAFERNMEAVYLLWRYAITGLSCNILDTRTVSDTLSGLSVGMYGFDVVDIAKRNLLLDKTESSNVYRITKE